MWLVATAWEEIEGEITRRKSNMRHYKRQQLGRNCGRYHRGGVDNLRGVQTCGSTSLLDDSNISNFVLGTVLNWEPESDQNLTTLMKAMNLIV